MPALYEPDVEENVDVFSTNDSHLHIDHGAAKRREKLGLTLKPGETNEVDVPGTAYQCKQCNPDGKLDPIVRPSNATYDRSLDKKKRDEMDEMRREMSELRDMNKELLAMMRKKFAADDNVKDADRKSKKDPPTTE